MTILFIRRAAVRTALAAATAAVLWPVSAQAANGASIGAGSVPTSLAASATAQVTIPVTNTGTTTWPAQSAYRLAATPSNGLEFVGYSCGGYMNNITDGRVYTCTSTAPGATHNYVFTIRMPAGATGSRTLSLQMVQDGVQFFGSTRNWTITVAAGSTNNASIGAGSVPASLAASATSQVTIPVTNTGTTTWPAQSAYRLAATSSNGLEFVGYSCGGYMNNITDGRVYTCTTTAPNQTHNYVFTIRMPAGATGSRTLSLRMVQDGVQFFGATRNWTITVSGTTNLPDVVVDSVSVSPASPTAGQAVTFSSVVRNAGTAATPSGVVIGVGYRIDGTQVTYGTVNGPLAAGASVTVGTTGGAWTATSGTHTLMAVADDVNRFNESNENNNTRSINFTVGGGGGAPSLWGMNIDPANPGGNPSAATLKAAGVRWVRVEWKVPQGFSFYDPILTAYRAAGLKVMLIIDYASVSTLKPAWNAGDAAWNAYRPLYNSQVSAIAQHYGGSIDAWQIWNEQDLNAPVPGYDPGVPANQYALMLRDAVTAIRAYSTAPIMWGGLASGNAGYVGSVRTALGGTLPGDYIAVHPYGQRAPDNWPNSSWGFGNMSTLFNNYLAYGKNLIVSEIGVDTTDTAFQADYLQNVYQLVSGSYSGRVVTVFWFCWSDAMVANFGVLYSNGTQKASYTRYQSLAGPWTLYLGEPGSDEAPLAAPDAADRRP
jgi:hypothetical protein